MAGLVKRGNVYYCRIQYGGNERWISTHQTSERAARKAMERIEAPFLRERETHHLTNQLLDVVKQLAARQLSIEECRGPLAAIESLAREEALRVIDGLLPAPALTAPAVWKSYMETGPDLKPSTLETKRQRFEKFIEWAGDRDVSHIGESDCRAFFRFLGPIKSHTHNNYLSDLSSVWKALPSLENPWGEHLRRRLEVDSKQPFTIDQVRQLLTYCRENGERFWHSAVLISYYTGLRLKDVVMLERSQITADGYLDLLPAKTERSKKRVRIPIRPELARELSCIELKSLKHFFPDQVEIYERRRGVLTVQFGRLLAKAGLSGKGYGFHSLRHTFVTEALKAGVSLKHVQAVVGHTSVELTEGTYYHGERNADLSAYPAL